MMKFVLAAAFMAAAVHAETAGTEETAAGETAGTEETAAGETADTEETDAGETTAGGVCADVTWTHVHDDQTTCERADGATPANCADDGTFTQCIEEIPAGTLLWADRPYAFLTAPSELLGGKWGYVTGTLNDGACAVNRLHDHPENSGGFHGALAAESHVAICCAGHHADWNFPTTSTDGIKWHRHEGDFAIAGHDGEPCVFFEATFPAGDHTICCDPGWGSGLFISASGDDTPVGELENYDTYKPPPPPPLDYAALFAGIDHKIIQSGETCPDGYKQPDDAECKGFALLIDRGAFTCGDCYNHNEAGCYVWNEDEVMSAPDPDGGNQVCTAEGKSVCICVGNDAEVPTEPPFDWAGLLEGIDYQLISKPDDDTDVTCPDGYAPPTKAQCFAAGAMLGLDAFECDDCHAFPVPETGCFVWGEAEVMYAGTPDGSENPCVAWGADGHRCICVAEGSDEFLYSGPEIDSVRANGACPDGYGTPTPTECQLIAAKSGVKYEAIEEAHPEEYGCFHWADYHIEFMPAHDEHTGEEVCPIEKGDGNCYCIALTGPGSREEVARALGGGGGDDDSAMIAAASAAATLLGVAIAL